MQVRSDGLDIRKEGSAYWIITRRNKMPHLTLGEFVVWLIVGALAGSLAGRIATLSKEGYGTWINIGVGMVGALLGGFLFKLFKIDLGLGDLNVSFQDLVAAFVGSLLCILLGWMARRAGSRSKAK
jgi:uncharacterized membrane protein YeaQ/YmgE (transglycosylase-associated protein family)